MIWVVQRASELLGAVCLYAPSTGVQSPPLLFYMSAGDLNSGLHACMSKTLPMSHLLNPMLVCLLNVEYLAMHTAESCTVLLYHIFLVSLSVLLL